MCIKSTTLAILSLIFVVALAAGFAGYRLGKGSIPGVMAQTQSAAQSVTTSRDSYAYVVDRVAPAK